MKKVFSILLALAMIFSMAACSSKEEAPAEETTPAEETSEETAEETAEETSEEEGQNPVMNFVGDYASDRCTITVEAGEGNVANITVDWASSAAERPLAMGQCGQAPSSSLSCCTCCRHSAKRTRLRIFVFAYSVLTMSFISFLHLVVKHHVSLLVRIGKGGLQASQSTFKPLCRLIAYIYVASCDFVL